MHMFIINITNLVMLNLEIGILKLVLEEKPLHQIAFWRFPKDKLSVLKQEHPNMSVHLSATLPLWNEHRDIIVKIFLRVFFPLTFLGLE
jgi:hypothetical protein